jgi:hypothetical protein
MHDKTLNASPLEGFPTHNQIGDRTGEISRVSGDTFLGFLNWFYYLFSKFLQESKLVGILVFHTSTPFFLRLTIFSFMGNYRGIHNLYKACTCIHVP